MAEGIVLNDMLAQHAAMLVHATEEAQDAAARALLELWRQREGVRRDETVELKEQLRGALAGAAGLPGAVVAERVRAVMRGREESAIGPDYTLASIEGLEAPERILWPSQDDTWGAEGVIAGRGEMALLSGGGGGGKSTITLDVALYGAAALVLGWEELTIPARLSVGPMRTMIAGYEDRVARLSQRLSFLHGAWRAPYRVAVDDLEGGWTGGSGSRFRRSWRTDWIGGGSS